MLATQPALEHPGAEPFHIRNARLRPSQRTNGSDETSPPFLQQEAKKKIVVKKEWLVFRNTGKLFLTVDGGSIV